MTNKKSCVHSDDSELSTVTLFLMDFKDTEQNRAKWL